MILGGTAILGNFHMAHLISRIVACFAKKTKPHGPVAPALRRQESFAWRSSKLETASAAHHVSRTLWTLTFSTALHEMEMNEENSCHISFSHLYRCLMFVTAACTHTLPIGFFATSLQASTGIPSWNHCPAIHLFSWVTSKKRPPDWQRALLKVTR